MNYFAEALGIMSDQKGCMCVCVRACTVITIDLYIIYATVVFRGLSQVPLLCCTLYNHIGREGPCLKELAI